MPEFLINCWMSFSRVLVGGGIAIILGIILGFIRYSLPSVLQRNFIVNLVLDAPKFPPPIAWIPFVVLYIGIGDISSLSIVIIGVLPPVFTQVYDGLKSIKVEVLQTARSMELSKINFFKLILLPAIMPQLMTGIRIGMAMGWMSIVAAEMISGQSGLGYSIQAHRLNLQYQNMVYDMLAIGLIGYGMIKVIGELEQRMVKWKV